MIYLLICAQFFLNNLNYPSLDVKNIDHELIADANTVIRYDNVIVEVIKLDKQKVTFESAATILNKEGEQEYQGVFMPYNGKYDKIEDIKIEILDAGGRIIKRVKKKEIGDQSNFDGFSIASDARYKFYGVKSASFPYTIKFSYSIGQKNTGFLPDFNPVRNYHTSVEKATFQILCDIKDYSVSMSAQNAEEGNIILDKEKLTCEMSNVRAIIPESYSIRYRDRIPSVSFCVNHFSYFGVEGDFSDWNGYAQWMYNNLLADRGNLPASLLSEISERIPENADDEAIARVIYDYIVSNMRYVSIQLGIGGYEPFSCSETYDKKYGDCKALSFLAFNLLEHFGVNSKYTIVHADSKYEVDLDPRLPGIGQGNHIIICLPEIKDTVWLECTSKIPFGHVSSFTDNRKVFVVDESGGSIVKTKKLIASDNKIVYNFTKNIAKNLSVIIEGKNEYHGANIEQWRRTQLMTSDEINEILIKDFYSDLPRFQVVNHRIEELIKPQIFINEVLSFEVPKFIEKAGKYLIVPVFDISIPVRQKTPTARKSQIYIRHPREIVYTEVIPIPKSYSLVEKDYSLSFQNIFGSIDTKQTFEEDQLILELHIIRNSGIYPAEHAPEFNQFQDVLYKLQQQSITLKQGIKP